MDALRQHDALARRVDQVQVIEHRLTGEGTSFPSGPITSSRFYRSDLGFECYYDGTRWLTVNEYSITLYERLALAAGIAHDWKIRVDYAIYVTYVAVSTSVVAPNGAGNFWNVFVQGLNLAISATTTVLQVVTSGDTAGVATDHGQAPATPNPANKDYLRFIATVGAGAPGVLTTACTVFYRLIIV